MKMLRSAFTWVVKEAKNFFKGQKRKREDDFEGNPAKRNNVNRNFPSAPAKNRKERKRIKKRQKKEMAKERMRKCKGVVNTAAAGDGNSPNKVNVTIGDLKVEVGKVSSGLFEIKKKLDISLEVQAGMSEELGRFRRSFEEKMVEELDSNRKKIEALQQTINHKDDVVVEKIQEKRDVEAELAMARNEIKELGNNEELIAEAKTLMSDYEDKKKKLEVELRDIAYEKEAAIESRRIMEADMAKLKQDVKEKEMKLQEMMKKESEATTSGSHSASLRMKVLKILNHGSVADLKELPKVGPVRAQKILEIREAKRGFKDVSDLKAIGYAFYIEFVRANHLDI